MTTIPTLLLAGAVAAAAHAGAPRERLVFVSRPVSPVFVGGLTGADLVCREAARATGLEGVFLAWLGDGVLGPADRFDRRPGAFMNARGERLAASWNELTHGTLAAEIVGLDGRPAGTPPWSNVRPDGTTGGLQTACDRWWNATAGAQGGVDRIWSGDPQRRQTAPCDSARAFYCVQQ